MKNDTVAPLPDFTRCLIEEALQVWSWGPLEKEKKRLRDLLDAIALLKNHGLCGTGVIGAYHMRRVSPLMACALPLYGMTPGAELGGTVLAQGLLCDNEVVQCIKEVMEEFDTMFLILGHPTMWLDTGFVELPAGLGFWASVVRCQSTCP